jgi:CheY-like chemotaxis protein
MTNLETRSPSHVQSPFKGQPWLAWSGSRARILLAENDDDNRDLLRTLFESSGFEVADCPSGDDVVALVRSLQPDLVIVNGRLRGEDGWTVCRRLRAAEMPIKKTPLILISASGEASNAARAVTAGCTLYFDEPFNIHAFLLAANAVVGCGRQTP